MLPEEIRRQAKARAVDQEIIDRFNARQDEMLAAFKSMSLEQKREGLTVLIMRLGALISWR